MWTTYSLVVLIESALIRCLIHVSSHIMSLRWSKIKFKSAAKAFVRTYEFLGSILPYGTVEWEKLSIFLNLLIPKLPSPREDDLSEGIISAIDLDSYRNEAQEAVAIKLEDEDAEITSPHG